MQNVIMILKLLPAIIEAIKAIELALPGQTAGEAKLALLREILEAVDQSTQQLWPAISKVVEVLVKAFNATGVFQK